MSLNFIMKMKPYAVALVTAAVLMTCVSFSLGDETAAKADAAKAAYKWLALFDKRDYSASYGSAASALAKSMTRQQFALLVGSARDELGRVINRRIVSETNTTAVPGAPEGQYVVIRYDTSFEHRKSGVESLIMMKEEGVWRVWNYEMPNSPFAPH